MYAAAHAILYDTDTLYITALLSTLPTTTAEADAVAAAKAAHEAKLLEEQRNKPISEGGFKFVARPINWNAAPITAVPSVRCVLL
jgi:hypothetical protein